MIAVIGGITAGGAVCVGFALLVYRRLRFPRVRVTTTRIDVVTFALLALGIVTGMLATLTNIGDAVHYRESVGPYFRNLFVLDPEPELMTGGGVTFIFQLHVTRRLVPVRASGPSAASSTPGASRSTIRGAARSSTARAHRTPAASVGRPEGRRRR